MLNIESKFCHLHNNIVADRRSSLNLNCTNDLDDSSYFSFSIKVTLLVIKGLFSSAAICLIRPCSHYAKFCLLCKKVCQQEATSSANDCLHQPKLSQLPANFKNAVENQRRLTIFCQATKSFVLWHEYPLSDHLALFCAHDHLLKFISKTFLVIRKISRACLRCEQGWKTKNWWLQKFRCIRAKLTLWLQ